MNSLFHMRACIPLTITKQIWRNFSTTGMVRNANSGRTPSSILPEFQTAPKELMAKDILIYKFEAPRFFRNLNIFAITQYTFWIVISFCGLGMIDVKSIEKENASQSDPSQSNEISLSNDANSAVSKDNAKSNTQDEDLPFWRKINLGSEKYKHGLAIGAACMGFSILFVSWTYILRSVKYLVLRKDGKTVSFVTYTPFGQNRILDIPIKNVSAAGSRNSGTTQMPVKVKGKSLFYLIDLKDGKFPHPQLFDKTVGTRRKFN